MIDNQPLTQSAIFLIQTLFSLYIMAIMLRFILQIVRADFYNPVVQFIVKITNPPLKPLRRIIPGIAGVDMASVVLMLALQLVSFLLVSLVLGSSPQVLGLLIASAGKLLALLLNVWLFAIIIQVIISWVGSNNHNPITGLLHSITEPVLGRARRIIPPISGFDLSPIAAMVVIQLLKILLVGPINHLAKGFM